MNQPAVLVGGLSILNVLRLRPQSRLHGRASNETQWLNRKSTKQPVQKLSKHLSILVKGSRSRPGTALSQPSSYQTIRARRPRTRPTTPLVEPRGCAAKKSSSRRQARRFLVKSRSSGTSPCTLTRPATSPQAGLPSSNATVAGPSWAPKLTLFDLGQGNVSTDGFAKGACRRQRAGRIAANHCGRVAIDEPVLGAPGMRIAVLILPRASSPPT